MAEADKMVTIMCPRCKAQGNAPIWDKIDAQLSKRDARHVLNESIFDVTCSQCGYRVSLNYPLVYHDGEHRFVVHYVADESRITQSSAELADVARYMIGRAARARALADKAGEEDAARIETEAASAPDALEGYRLRIVTTRNALREKVAILRGGMNDYAIEALKLATFNLATSQRKLKGATDVYYGGVSKANTIGMKFTGGRKYHEMDVPWATYENVLADVNAYRAGAPDEHVVDRAWAERFLAALEGAKV